MTVLTVFDSVVTVELSALVSTVSDKELIDAVFSSTVWLSSLNVWVLTLVPISVSRVVVRPLSEDNSSSVSVFQLLISLSNCLIPEISPFAS